MTDNNSDSIRARLAEIEAYRAAMAPAKRADLERREIEAQRESWIRGMAPCDHGDPDWETCPQCRPNTATQPTGEGSQ